MEACCGEYWLACKLASFSYQVQLIAPQYVRPFVTGNKNDFLDAKAICEAASQPRMRYVGVKTPDQQAVSAFLYRPFLLSVSTGRAAGALMAQSLDKR